MPPGQLDRYEIVEELGRGAMGIVYKARDPLIDRIVALKTIALDLSGDEAEAFEQRFYREAKSAGRLNHSSIVTIYDVGKSGGVAYIAMEYLQGRSLRDILDSGVVIPVERIADIIAQVADGLAFAHENNVVHRDIKPANIMVLESRSVKIMDFGIAHLPAGSRTVGGTVFGSPKYMAPERIAGEQVDGRADIFSLGAVLYEMLTGFAPFFAGDLETLLDQVINVTPAPPRSRNKTIPFSFDHIVATSMAKSPEDRYQDARAMATAVRNFRDLRAPGAVPHWPVSSARASGASTPTHERTPVEPSPAAAVVAVVAPQHDDAPEIVPAPGIGFGQRRRLVVYGGTAALIALLAGAAVLSRRAANAPPAPQQSEGVAPAAELADASPRGAGSPTPQDEPSPSTTVAAAAPSVPQPSPSAEVKPPPPAEPPMARLSLAVAPWGEVYVDGKRKGVAPPLTEIRLAPGKHTIEIRNTTFPSFAQSVDLAANGSLKIRHKFQ